MADTEQKTARRKHGQTKIDLIDTAELVFGQNGMDKTTVRMIVSELGVNVAAINFHFGTFDVLKEEVLLRRFGPLVDERVTLLEKFRMQDKIVPVPNILTAWVSPVVRMATSPETGKRAFVRILARALFEPDPTYTSMLTKQLRPHLDVFLDELGRALPEIEKQHLAQRFNFFLGAFGRSLVEEIRLEPPRPRKYRQRIDQIASQLIEFSTAGLSA